MKTGLSALLYPHSIDDFFTLYKQGKPFFVSAKNESLKPLTDLPILESLEALLRQWPFPIKAHLPDIRDEVSSIDTTTKDAGKLFQNGMGLLFEEANLVSPILGKWLEEIRKDLGLSQLTQSRCLLYATPNNKGTAPHFDQNINIVLQVRGTKTWLMAPNHHVTGPLSRHTMGVATDPELSTYTESPFPTSMPKEHQSFVLTPGSVLYVPRGYWHATEAAGDALSLNFTYTAPSWVDLFTAALRSRLILSDEWRETVDGVSDRSNRKIPIEKLDTLLSELKNDLPNWKAADILEATEDF